MPARAVPRQTYRASTFAANRICSRSQMTAVSNLLLSDPATPRQCSILACVSPVCWTTSPEVSSERYEAKAAAWEQGKRAPELLEQGYGLGNYMMERDYCDRCAGKWMLNDLYFCTNCLSYDCYTCGSNFSEGRERQPPGQLRRRVGHGSRLGNRANRHLCFD